MRTRIPDGAFEYYFSLGASRSHRAVAEKFGVSKRGVTKLAGRENWAARITRAEKEANERFTKKMVASLEETQDRHLQTAHAILGRALEGLKQFPITSAMEAVRAADMAIKLERLVVGEPTERNALTIEEVTRA